MQETVNDVMSKKVVAVLPGDTLEEAARLMKEHDVGVLPVVSGGELKGLVTDRDVYKRQASASERAEPGHRRQHLFTAVPAPAGRAGAGLFGGQRHHRLPERRAV